VRMDRDRAGADGCAGNAAPYVLGALTGAEHEAFILHLEDCAVCREEVAALQMVASALPATAPQIAAPEKLKRRVMAQVHEDARRERQADSSTATRRFRWQARPWAFAPAALGLAVLALLAVVIAREGSGSGATRVIPAQVSVAGASASVRLSAGNAELTIAGMPQTRPGRVYELWVKRAGAPEPTDALFTVTSHGQARVGVPGGDAGVKLVMVTSEPLGGSSVPTSSPIVVARLG
jgi:anti-sigma-K factor RskA